jgi:hypothetical protein
LSHFGNYHLAHFGTIALISHNGPFLDNSFHLKALYHKQFTILLAVSGCSPFTYAAIGRNRLIFVGAFVSVCRTKVASKSTILKWSWLAGCAFCAGSVFGQTFSFTLPDNATHQALFSSDDFKITLDLSGRSSGSVESGLNITLALPRSIQSSAADANFAVSDFETSSLTSLGIDRPSSEWTLFLADLDYGERGTPASWSLVVTAVPEPGTIGLLALGLSGVAGMRCLRRRS